MTEQEASDLESRFGLSFPSAYRAKLIDYPFSDDQEAFTCDIQALIDENESNRAEDPWEFTWQDSYWFIGIDEGGGFYFIDCSRPDSAVYHFGYDNFEIDDPSDPSTFAPSTLDEHLAGCG